LFGILLSKFARAETKHLSQHNMASQTF